MWWCKAALHFCIDILMMIFFLLLLIILIMDMLATSFGRMVTWSMLSLALLPSLRPLVPFWMTYRHPQGGFQVRNLPVFLIISFILSIILVDTSLLMYHMCCSFILMASICFAYLEKF